MKNYIQAFLFLVLFAATGFAQAKCNVQQPADGYKSLYLNADFGNRNLTFQDMYEFSECKARTMGYHLISVYGYNTPQLDIQSNGYYSGEDRVQNFGNQAINQGVDRAANEIYYRTGGNSVSNVIGAIGVGFLRSRKKEEVTVFKYFKVDTTVTLIDQARWKMPDSQPMAAVYLLREKRESYDGRLYDVVLLGVFDPKTGDVWMPSWLPPNQTKNSKKQPYEHHLDTQSFEYQLKVLTAEQVVAAVLQPR